VASNAPNHPEKRRKMLVLQAVLRHVWPVFSYLHKSVALIFPTIAHPRDFREITEDVLIAPSSERGHLTVFQSGK
jgi:hypothetical protein